MSATEWIEVLGEHEIPERTMIEVRPKGLPVILIKYEGIIHALSGVCAHLGCPLIDGSLEREVLTCSCHDWCYNVVTGQFLVAPEIVLEKFETKLEDGSYFVRI